MKHYTRTKSYEEDAFRYGSCYGGKDKYNAETKRIYRGRERAALKRDVASEIAEDAVTPEEVNYWKRKLFDEAVEDSRWADEADESDFEDNWEFVLDAREAADHKAERIFDAWLDARHELRSVA